MVQNGIFWTIGKQLYMIDYPIMSLRKIKFYRAETMNMGRSHWNNGVSGDDCSGRMVSAGTAIVVSNIVLIVRDKILW